MASAAAATRGPGARRMEARVGCGVVPARARRGTRPKPAFPCALLQRVTRAGQAPAQALGGAQVRPRRSARVAAREPAWPASFGPSRPSTRRARGRALLACARADRARHVAGRAYVWSRAWCVSPSAGCSSAFGSARRRCARSPFAPSRACVHRRWPSSSSLLLRGWRGGIRCARRVAVRARARARCPKSAGPAQAAVGAELKKYGLRYDDLLDPTNNLDVNEAMQRLPQAVRGCLGCGCAEGGVR